MVVAVVFCPLADPESPFRMGWIADVTAAFPSDWVKGLPVHASMKLSPASVLTTVLMALSTSCSVPPAAKTS